MQPYRPFIPTDPPYALSIVLDEDFVIWGGSGVIEVLIFSFSFDFSRPVLWTPTPRIEGVSDIQYDEYPQDILVA